LPPRRKQKMNVDDEDDHYDSEESKRLTAHWEHLPDWQYKTLKREITIPQFNESTFTARCFESSFLFRVLYHYQTYISKFVFDSNTRLLNPPIRSLNSIKPTLTNTLIIALEQSVLSDYYNSYMTALPDCLALPPDPFDFLWNFFLFLSETDVKLNCIKPLEACEQVFLSFSRALLLSRLSNVDPGDQQKKRLWILDIVRHTNVIGRMHSHVRQSENKRNGT